MKKHISGILLLLCLICFSSLLWVACGGTEADNGLKFAEGARTTYQLGETITFDEYIENIDTFAEEYSLVITGKDYKGNDYHNDVTGKFAWTPDEVGEYVICWTVSSGENRGSVSIEIEVEPPKPTWEYTLDNTVYKTNDTFNFQDYYEKLNIAVKPRLSKFIMDSVTVDGVTTNFDANNLFVNDDRVTVNFDSETGYTFASFSDHFFEFHMETIYGQVKNIRQTIRIKRVDDETQAFLDDNDITEYNAVSIYNGGVTLGNSFYGAVGTTGAPRSSATPIDISYLAYNGNYGINSYVAFDYTGNNMPVVGFFVNEATKSYFNDGKGIVIANGFTDNYGSPFQKWTGSLNSRLNIYGPKKIDEPDNEAVGSIRGISRNEIISMTSQSKEENARVRYRVVMGVSSATSSKIEVSVCLLNSETGVVLTNLKIALDAKKYVSAITEKVEYSDDYAFTERYFSGKIILWGQFGKNTALDKIYPIVNAENINDAIEQLFPVSQVKHTCVPDVLVGQQLKVEDFFVTEEGYDYTLYKQDESGNIIQIDGDPFSFEKEGNYTLIFNDGLRQNTFLDIKVTEFSNTVESWLKDNNISFHNAQIDDRGKIILGTSEYYGTGYATSSQKSDVSYISFNGNYGINDYIVLDYTGNNMPTILMFGGYTTNSYHYDATMQTDENKGLVITNGMTLSATGELFENWNGSVNKRLNVVGPNKVHYNLGNNPEGWFRKNIGYDSECSMVYQAENPDKAFRLAIGLTNITTNSFSITVYLFDRATDMLLHSETKEFTGISLGNDYYSGNIVIYGQYGKETVVDQAYIVNAMDLNGILTQVNENYSGVCAFRENAVDSCVVGESVSVSGMIEDANNFTLTLVKNGEIYMQIADNSFAVQDAGEYELYYWDQSNNKPIKMQFTVRQNV